MPVWITDIITVWPMLGVTILVVFCLALILRVFGPVAKKISVMADDWNGEPARKGREASPGVMERLQTTDQWQAKYGPLIDKLDHELHPNSGGSLADSVYRQEAALNEHIASCPIAQGTTTVTVNTGGTP